MAVDLTPLSGGPYGDRLTTILAAIEAAAGGLPIEVIAYEDWLLLDPPDPETIYVITGAPGGVAPHTHSGEHPVNNVTSSGSTETLSAAFAMHKVVMNTNCTFTFTSPSDGAEFSLLLSGAFTPTWPASVDWPDGTPPTYTTPSLYVFRTFDGGVTWQGSQAGKAYA